MFIEIVAVLLPVIGGVVLAGRVSRRLSGRAAPRPSRRRWRWVLGCRSSTTSGW